MEKENLDNLLYSRTGHYKNKNDDKFIDHYLEQYRIYLHIFNSTSDRRNKANEFFLGLNTAIIGVLGYLESKSLADSNSAIYFFAPFVGIAICYSWYQIIISYRQLNRGKFKIIHEIEEKLPIALFKDEWEILGKGKDKRKYYPLSIIERKIPLIFITLYIVILMTSLPWNLISSFFR